MDHTDALQREKEKPPNLEKQDKIVKKALPAPSHFCPPLLFYSRTPLLQHPILPLNSTGSMCFPVCLPARWWAPGGPLDLAQLSHHKVDSTHVHWGSEAKKSAQHVTNAPSQWAAWVCSLSRPSPYAARLSPEHPLKNPPVPGRSLAPPQHRSLTQTLAVSRAG